MAVCNPPAKKSWKILHRCAKIINAIKQLIVVVFSVMYALCSFAVVHQNNIMWTDAIIWLPIIAYAIEQIIINRKYKLFVISLSLTIMSNYYIGYMVCIFCVVYFIYFHLAHGKDVRNPYEKKYHTLKSCLNFVIFSLIAAAIAASTGTSTDDFVVRSIRKVRRK